MNLLYNYILIYLIAILLGVFKLSTENCISEIKKFFDKINENALDFISKYKSTTESSKILDVINYMENSINDLNKLYDDINDLYIIDENLLSHEDIKKTIFDYCAIADKINNLNLKFNVIYLNILFENKTIGNDIKKFSNLYNSLSEYLYNFISKQIIKITLPAENEILKYIDNYKAYLNELFEKIFYLSKYMALENDWTQTIISDMINNAKKINIIYNKLTAFEDAFLESGITKSSENILKNILKKFENIIFTLNLLSYTLEINIENDVSDDIVNEMLFDIKNVYEYQNKILYDIHILNNKIIDTAYFYKIKNVSKDFISDIKLIEEISFKANIISLYSLIEIKKINCQKSLSSQFLKQINNFYKTCMSSRNEYAKVYYILADDLNKNIVVKFYEDIFFHAMTLLKSAEMVCKLSKDETFSFNTLADEIKNFVKHIEKIIISKKQN